MEIKLKIGYEQLVGIIQQLPIDEVNKLKAEIKIYYSELEAMKDFESFIANGPVMSDEKFQVEENRKYFTEWRAN